MLASPRGFSQLATSFIAYLRQGIHTHALSSLTIKLTLRSEFSLLARLCLTEFASGFFSRAALLPHIGCVAALQLVVARQILFNCQRTQIPTFAVTERQELTFATHECWLLPSDISVDALVGLDRLELSTSPLSGVRSSHLSYRPGSSMVGLGRLKLPRSPLSEVRVVFLASRRGHLSYRPAWKLVELVGIEPATS